MLYIVPMNKYIMETSMPSVCKQDIWTLSHDITCTIIHPTKNTHKNFTPSVLSLRQLGNI